MKVQPCKRWVVVFGHDSQPVDGTLYVHKSKAIEEQGNLKNSDKYRVEQVSILDTQMMDSILNQLSELEKGHHAR